MIKITPRQFQGTILVAFMLAAGWVITRDASASEKKNVKAPVVTGQVAELDANDSRVRKARVYLAWMAGKDTQLQQQGRTLLEKEPAAVQLALLKEGIRFRTPSIRTYSAKRLATVSVPGGFQPLLRTALHDKNASVRTVAATALKTPAYARAVHVFGRALFSRAPVMQRRALGALASLGDEIAVGYIVERWSKRSGDFTRVYFQQMNQLSYIQDFDVEVASTSFIADPVVAILQEGVLQDVKVIATSQEGTTIRAATFRSALRSIAGSDQGGNVGAWRKYWNKNQQQLASRRAKRLRSKTPTR